MRTSRRLRAGPSALARPPAHGTSVQDHRRVDDRRRQQEVHRHQGRVELGQHHDPADHGLARRRRAAGPPTATPGRSGGAARRLLRRCHIKKAMNVSPAIATSGKFSSRLPNSIAGVQLRLPDAVRGDGAGLGAVRPVGAAEPRRRQPHRRAGGDDHRVGDHRRQRPAARTEPPRRPRETGGRDARQTRKDTPHIVTPGATEWQGRRAALLGQRRPLATRDAADPGPFGRAQPLARAWRGRSAPPRRAAATSRRRTAGRHPPQRLELQPVRDDRRQQPDARRRCAAATGRNIRGAARDDAGHGDRARPPRTSR